jgi:hypothetical protein
LSDFPPELIEAYKARDKRIRMIDLGYAIQAELRDSVALKAMIATVRDDAEAAMEELADLSPADTIAIAGALVRVRTLVYWRRTLNLVLGHAAAAETHVRAEDEMEQQE